jgi:hypothetical protein
VVGCDVTLGAAASLVVSVVGGQVSPQISVKSMLLMTSLQKAAASSSGLIVLLAAVDVAVALVAGLGVVAAGSGSVGEGWVDAGLGGRV